MALGVKVLGSELRRLPPPQTRAAGTPWKSAHWALDPQATAAIFKLFHLMAHINQLLKFYCTPKNIFFANMTKNIGILLIHSHQTAIVVLAVVIFYLTV